MKLFGFEINRAKNKPPAAGEKSPYGWQLKPNDGQGVYTKYFRSYIPRKVEASFYEFLREAIPIIDAAIMRLVSLEGRVVVKGNNENLVEEIKDWIENVPVNDIQTGLQSFHQGLSNEAFEQGFALGEFITDRKRTDIVGLRVADSKYIKFKRVPDKGLEIYQKGDGDIDYRKLTNTENLLYFSINNENQNPYGTPLMRSCEFVAKILATIHNSMLNVWERYGDPPMQLIYKTSKRDAAVLATRESTLRTDLNTAMTAKRSGKSADFVHAIDKESDIVIKVIGADGQTLDLEVPARHVIEQIVAKTGMPPWMLGLHWSTTERLANFEVEMLLADISTRQAAKLPQFEKLIKTLLLLRGRAWKKGDWRLEWEQVNLHDVVKQAQARFLNAQADMYYLQNAEAAGISLDVSDLAIGKKTPGKKVIDLHRHKCACHKDKSTSPTNCKELQRPDPWPELDGLESEFEGQLKTDWRKLEEETLAILNLSDSLPKRAKDTAPPDGLPSEAFIFNEEQKSRISQALREFYRKYAWKAADDLAGWFYGRAYSFGLLRAVKQIGKERPVLDIIHNSQVFEALAKKGFELVKDNATRAIKGKIIPEMEAQMLASTNPRHVAARLKKLFSDKNSDWERLARSEMNRAAEKAKLDEWKEWDINKVEFVPAPDACSICAALAGVYDIDKCPLPVESTHPRCRCSTRPAAQELKRAA